MLRLRPWTSRCQPDGRDSRHVVSVHGCEYLPNERRLLDEKEFGDRWESSVLIEDLKEDGQGLGLGILFLPHISGLSTWSTLRSRK